MLALLLDAEIVARGPEGERTVAGLRVLPGLLRDRARPGEILTEVRFPRAPDGAALEEFARRHGDFAIVAAAAAVGRENGACTHARVVVGGVDEVPLRVEDAEEVLTGSDLGEEAIEEAAQAAARAVDPGSDVHGSAEYRRRADRGPARARIATRGGRWALTGAGSGARSAPSSTAATSPATAAFVDDLERPGLRHARLRPLAARRRRASPPSTRRRRAACPASTRCSPPRISARPRRSCPRLRPRRLRGRRDAAARARPRAPRRRARRHGRRGHAARGRGRRRARARRVRGGPAVASIEAAIEDDAPAVHDEAPGNLLLDVQFADDDVEPGTSRAPRPSSRRASAPAA